MREETEIEFEEKETAEESLSDKLFKTLGISEWVKVSKPMQVLWYGLFLLGIGIFHIYNSHSAEGKIRSINKLEKEIRELDWEYTSVKSDLMLKSKQSVLEEKLLDNNISTIKEPSKRIVVKADEYKD